MSTGLRRGGLSAGGWRILILGALSASGPLSNDTYLPALPSLARDLHVTASLAQLTLTASLAGLGIGQLLAGPLSDRIGRRGPLIGGMAVFAIASLVCALTDSIAVLVGARFLQGFAGAAGIAVSRAVVRDLYSGSAMARYFSVLLLVTGLAPVLAPVLGGLILGFTSWRGIFVALTAIGAVMAVMTALRLEETLPPERRHAGGIRAVGITMGRLASDRRFVAYALGNGCAFGAMFAYIAGSPFVIQDIYGASPQVFSAVFAVNSLGIIALGRLNARLLHRWAPQQLMAAGFVQASVGATVLLVAVCTGAGVWPVLVGLFIVVSCVAAITQNGMALALDPYPHVAGSAAAVIGVLQFAIGAATAPLVGIAGSATAVPMAITMAGLVALGLVLTLAAGHVAPRAPAPARA